MSLDLSLGECNQRYNRLAVLHGAASAGKSVPPGGEIEKEALHRPVAALSIESREIGQLQISDLATLLASFQNILVTRLYFVSFVY